MVAVRVYRSVLRTIGRRNPLAKGGLPSLAGERRIVVRMKPDVLSGRSEVGVVVVIRENLYTPRPQHLEQKEKEQRKMTPSSDLSPVLAKPPEFTVLYLKPPTPSCLVVEQLGATPLTVDGLPRIW